MNYITIRNGLREKPYFGVKEVSDIFGIKRNSARVLCSRLTGKGLMVRLKRDFYILREQWDNLQYEDFLKIANVLQVPSYISCMSALTFYDISTQVQRNFFESVSLKRTREFIPDGTVFNYYKIKKDLYFGFERKNGIFIAAKEKAFLDAVYLYSFGKYRFDISSISMGKLQKSKIAEILPKYPVKTRQTFKKIWTT
jgi:predicted transcriptional regulator of viral defense system